MSVEPDPNIGRSLMLGDEKWTILAVCAWPGTDYYYLGHPEEEDAIVRPGGLIRAELARAKGGDPG